MNLNSSKKHVACPRTEDEIPVRSNKIKSLNDLKLYFKCTNINFKFWQLIELNKLLDLRRLDRKNAYGFNFRKLVPFCVVKLQVQCPCIYNDCIRNA